MGLGLVSVGPRCLTGGVCMWKLLISMLLTLHPLLYWLALLSECCRWSQGSKLVTYRQIEEATFVPLALMPPLLFSRLAASFLS
jgi:hypothetical protein